MSTQEKDLYPLFSRFISSKWGDRGSATFELKIVPIGGRYRFNQLKPHQKRALTMSTLSTGVYHKISDQSQGSKPFDSFIICSCKAYVVICFYKHAYFLEIQNYIAMEYKYTIELKEMSVFEETIALYSSFDFHL